MGIESQIDLKKHVMYSPLMEKIIKKHLGRKYEGTDIEQIWEKIQQQYADCYSKCDQVCMDQHRQSAYVFGTVDNEE